MRLNQILSIEVRLLAVIICATSFWSPASNAQLIPSARLTDWTPGVRTGVIGGIPNRTSPVINVVTQYGADNTGATNAAPAIQNAINAATSGSVVFMPAGTYRFDTGIDLGPSRDNITLRGAGMDLTIISARTAVPIHIGSSSDYNWNWPPGGQPVTGGLAKDSTVLTMADTSWCSVGQIIRIGFSPQQDNAVIRAGGPLNFKVDGGGNFVHQKSRIVSKTATSLTIFPGIYHTPFAGQTAKVNVAQAQTDNTGVEDLTINGNSPVMSWAGINMEQAYNCWAKEREGYKLPCIWIYHS